MTILRHYHTYISLKETKMNLLFQLLKGPVGMSINHLILIVFIFNFSLEKIFPVLDIIRLLVLNSDVCKYLFEKEIQANEFISQILTYHIL